MASIAIVDNVSDYLVVFSAAAMKDKPVVEEYLNRLEYKMKPSKSNPRGIHVGKRTVNTLLDSVDSIVLAGYELRLETVTIDGNPHHTQIFIKAKSPQV